MIKRFLKWWHERRGYHGAVPRAISFERNQRIVVLLQTCTCGETRQIEATLAGWCAPSFIEYSYHWAA